MSIAKYLAFDTLDENALNVKYFVLFASTYKSMLKGSAYKSSLKDSIFRWISRGKKCHIRRDQTMKTEFLKLDLYA